MSSKPQINCLTLMGIGTIGGCCIQMIPDFMDLKELIVIDRAENTEARVQEYIDTSNFSEELKKIKLTVIKKAIDQENYIDVLGPLYERSDCVLDLTTVLSSVDLATLADKHNAVYENACVELFTKCAVSIKDRHDIVRELNLKKTCLFEHGMNPGVVSHILRVAMKDAGLVAEDLDLVHITEFDDHLLFPERKDPEAFYNTWSPFGLYEEATERAELAWPVSKECPCPDVASKSGNMVIFNELPGYQVYTDSVTPLIQDDGTFDGWKKYQGYVVTHGETETMAKLLGNEVICAFVFRTAPDATEALLKWKEEEAPKYVMMEGKDIQKGGDTIGVLLRSSTKKKAWWMGSAQTAAIAQKLVSPLQNGATVTVAAGCIAGIVWAFQNPNKGVCWPEDMDSFKAWEDTKKYMGYVNSMEVPYDLVADLDVTPKIGSPSEEMWNSASTKNLNA